MHITIITTGSRGDVQPYIALALGLREAGYSVRLATHAVFKDFVQSYALEFYAIDDEAQEIFQSDIGMKLLAAGENAFLFLYHLRNLVAARIEMCMQRCLWACQDADAIVVSYMSFILGYSLAEQLQKPLIATFLQPSQPQTITFPEPTVSWLPQYPAQFGQLINKQSHLYAGKIFWYSFSPAVNRARKTLFQLPPLSKVAPFATLSQQTALTLGAYSPTLIPRPFDWGDKIEITGFWMLDQSTRTWQPEAQFVDFLQAGPAPIYIGFGSMSSFKPNHSLQLAIQALKRSQQRGVIQVDTATLPAQQLTDQIYVINTAPHDWLFPRMSVIVHHGGAGSSATSLQAGIPTIVVAHISDQQFWGDRIAAIGVGPRPLHRRRLTARMLSDTINAVLKDTEMQKRAAAFGQQLSKEQGVKQAVAMINLHLSNHNLQAYRSRRQKNMNTPKESNYGTY